MGRIASLRHRHVLLLSAQIVSLLIASHLCFINYDGFNTLQCQGLDPDSNEAESSTCVNPDCTSPLDVRVITEEELKTKTGVDGGEIWISVLGEVFDVTKGQNFYGPGSGYSVFAGQDASPCFVSGNFNDEGAKQSLDDITAKDLVSIDGWRKFYKEGDNKYFFVGVLQGKYYHADGTPTNLLREVRLRIETIDQPVKPDR